MTTIVFSGDAATFKYSGSCRKDGHKTFRYDFRVPQASSRLLVSGGNSVDAVVGYHGSFWVDSETLDMVRLEWKTDHIPSSVGISVGRKIDALQGGADRKFRLPAAAPFRTDVF